MYLNPNNLGQFILFHSCSTNNRRTHRIKLPQSVIPRLVRVVSSPSMLCHSNEVSVQFYGYVNDMQIWNMVMNNLIQFIIWPLTPKIDGATWAIVKFDMRHEA